MHCPNCGSAASNDQQFCRTCGLNLEVFSQLLAEKRLTLKSELLDKKRNLERWALRLWTGAGAIFYIALYWAIIGKIIIGKRQVLGGTLFLLVITALSVGGLLLLYSAALEKRSKYMRSDPEDVLPTRDTSAGIISSGNPEAPISVTEHTTDELQYDQSKGTERRTSSRSN